MYEKMKAFLLRCVDVFVAVVLVAACGAYVVINSLLMTHVINDLRLDSYVTYETGLAVVMLVFLLGWGPVWLHRSLHRRG